MNLYYKDNVYDLVNDKTGTNFDNSLGSAIFSIKIHINNSFKVDAEYTKNEDFDECIYVLKPTDETRIDVQKSMKIIIDKAEEITNAKLLKEFEKNFDIQSENKEQKNERIKEIVNKVKLENFKSIAMQNSHLMKKTFDELKYEAVLNKQQY